MGRWCSNLCRQLLGVHATYTALEDAALAQQLHLMPWPWPWDAEEAVHATPKALGNGRCLQQGDELGCVYMWLQMLEGVETWRERILHPWKFNRIKHNDAELQKQVSTSKPCITLRKPYSWTSPLYNACLIKKAPARSARLERSSQSHTLPESMAWLPSACKHALLTDGRQWYLLHAWA